MLSQKTPANAEILLSVTGVFCGILQYVSGGRGDDHFYRFRFASAYSGSTMPAEEDFDICSA